MNGGEGFEVVKWNGDVPELPVLFVESDDFCRAEAIILRDQPPVFSEGGTRDLMPDHAGRTIGSIK